MNKKQIKIVLDTNIFINPDSRYFFGKSAKDALSNFCDQIKEKRNISCFMPPSINEELNKFIDTENIQDKTIVINKKPPSIYESSTPALFFYELIEELRNRINKGLRVAEKYTRKAIQSNNEKDLITSLREEYRLALREGIIDSKEDFDLILLARELNAYLATSDNGLVLWAQKLGINCISGKELKTLIEVSSTK